MAFKNTEAGKWAFTLGVLVALLAGIVVVFMGWGALNPNISGAIYILLVGFGLLVGFLNIGHKEMNTFLIASIAFLAVSAISFSSVPILFIYIDPILTFLAVFVAPATLVVALKAIWELGKTQAA